MKCRVTGAIASGLPLEKSGLSDDDMYLLQFHIANGSPLVYSIQRNLNRQIQELYSSNLNSPHVDLHEDLHSSAQDEETASNSQWKLPSFDALWNSHNGREDILFNEDEKPTYSNQCAVRVSEAFIESGFGLRNFKLLVPKGEMDRGYAIRALELKDWLSVIYGKPEEFTDKKALSKVEGRRGIVVIEQFKGIWEPDKVFNHIDFWNGKDFKGGEREWLNQPKTKVYFWEIKY